jgi:hypothetical protein
VEGRWHSIEDRGKESPKSIDIRIRDPTKSEFSNRSDKELERQLIHASEFHCIEYRESTNHSV